MRPMKSGGKQLAEWKVRRSLNLTEMAEELGLTKGFASMLIKGKRVPGRDKAVTIERLTGIPVAAWALTRRTVSPKGSQPNISEPPV